MSKYRRAAKVDKNQGAVIKALLDINGVSVEADHDDLLVGYKGRTYWIELKSEDAVSKKTGKVLESKIKKSQKKIRAEWTGQYLITASLDEILDEIGVTNGRK